MDIYCLWLHLPILKHYFAQCARVTETAAAEGWDRWAVVHWWETIQVSEEAVWERIVAGNH